MLCVTTEGTSEVSDSEWHSLKAKNMCANFLYNSKTRHGMTYAKETLILNCEAQRRTS